MRWHKRDTWKAVIPLAGVLLLFVFIALIHVSTVDAYGRMSALALPGTAIDTPTVDATMAALQKQQLELQVKQLQNQLQDQNNWFENNSTALIAAAATVLVALFGIYQWAGNRKKDLSAQAEDRFKAVVTGLGDEKEGPKIGAAIQLRTFLRSGHEQFYIQTFDLAVAHLRLPRTPNPPTDPDISQPLTTLSQALIVVFKEAFPLVRTQIKLQQVLEPFFLLMLNTYSRKKSLDELPGLPTLDATYIQLDNAYLRKADLRQIWMPEASLRGTNLVEAKLGWANLRGADLRGVDLTRANLFAADLRDANLKGADLKGARLHMADLRGANLQETILIETDLTKTDLREANLCNAVLVQADLGSGGFIAESISQNIFGARLSDANLSGADLRYANLSKADFGSAILSGANLGHAYLKGARLDRADLNGSTIEGAFDLKDADLRGVKGLTREQIEVCKTKGAIIDKDTTATSSHSSV